MESYLYSIFKDHSLYQNSIRICKVKFGQKRICKVKGKAMNMKVEKKIIKKKALKKAFGAISGTSRPCWFFIFSKLKSNLGPLLFCDSLYLLYLRIIFKF